LFSIQSIQSIMSTDFTRPSGTALFGSPSKSRSVWSAGSLLPLLPILAFCLAITPIQSRTATPDLLAPQNLTAWCVVPFDARKRGPAERAEMLQRLGFKNFAYDWRSKDVPSFDAEVDALSQRGIHLAAWWFPTDAEDPNARIILNVIKRHGIRPQLWVMGSGSPTKTDAEQAQRTEQEAERIRKIVELAAPFGCKVELYNHNGWFGQPDNEVAVIERLKEKEVGDVGMVYNFSHGHGDIGDFPAIWKRIEHYVVAVNVSGMVTSERLIPPSQGDSELEMLRTIQRSGWRGPIGLIAEQGGDAEVTLSNDLRGLDWLRREIAHPGSGGQRPVLISSPPDMK
jgi:sugar phosphate isomerase/epimerase